MCIRPQIVVLLLTLKESLQVAFVVQKGLCRPGGEVHKCRLREHYKTLKGPLVTGLVIIIDVLVSFCLKKPRSLSTAEINCLEKS